MISALLIAMLYLIIICAVAYAASIIVGQFLSPINPTVAQLANLAIGLIALVACVLVLINVISGVDVPHLT